MSSSNMCVLALCFVLFTVTQSRVIKTKEFPLSSEGDSTEVIVKNKSDKAHPLSVFETDIDQLMKKVTTSQEFKRGRRLPENRKLHRLTKRFGVRVGFCPSGFLKQGHMCFPKTSDY